MADLMRYRELALMEITDAARALRIAEMARQEVDPLDLALSAAKAKAATLGLDNEALANATRFGVEQADYVEGKGYLDDFNNPASRHHY